MASYSDFVTFKWENLPEDALEALALNYERRINSEIYQVVKEWAPEVEAWMKQNAPWQNISGDARAGLIAKAHLVFGKQIILRMSSSAAHGVYLEGWNPEKNAPMNNAGRWSIIEPALDFFGPKIWADIVSRFSS